MKTENCRDNMNSTDKLGAVRHKKQITINIDNNTIEYFKLLADEEGVPYQVLINLYLRDCVDNRRHLRMSWQ